MSCYNVVQNTVTTCCLVTKDVDILLTSCGLVCLVVSLSKNSGSL